MTPEQWRHINARLLALEMFVILIAKRMPHGEALRQEIRDQKELATVVALNSALPEDSLAESIRRLERLAQAVWGQEEQSP